MNLNYIYILNLNFINIKENKYLIIYYNYIKQNLIKKIFLKIKFFFLIKFNIKQFLNKFIYFNNIFNYCINSNYYNYFNYNNFKNYKIIYLKKVFKKLNRYLILLNENKDTNNFFEYYRNLFISKNFNIFFNNIKINLKYKFNFHNKFKNKIFFFNKINIYINYLYKLYVQYYYISKQFNNVILKYYFYFYNFIIKIFIKILNNFKVFLLNESNIIIKNFI